MISNSSQGDTAASGSATITVRGVGVVTARPDGVRVTFGVRHQAGTGEGLEIVAAVDARYLISPS